VCDEECVILNSSPIDFDLLFCQDNSTLLNEVLNGVGNHTWILPISPWGGFFTCSHIEGSDKWYLNSYRQLEIYSPHVAQFESITEEESSTFGIVQSNEVIFDVGFTIDIVDDCAITYGHLTLLKSIYDEIEATGEYSFTENEHIGYLHDTGAGWFGFLVYKRRRKYLSL